MTLKLKFRVPSWEEGRELLQSTAQHYGVEVEVRDADELIITDRFELRFHPDDRGFAFMTCKVYDRVYLTELQSRFAKYTQ